MDVKETLWKFYKILCKYFEEQFEFRISDVTFQNIVKYLHARKDSSSLAVTRILFGLAMLFDIPDERGGATMDRRWGDPRTCHFPLVPFVQAMPMPYMALVYAALWIGALGIMLGYKYRISSSMFTICYWYLFLIEKSFWNNHSYLFGLVALLLTFTQANCYWSLDAYLSPNQKKQTVPYWNYFVLKYQFFILYFMAGMKKSTAEWLTGYSVLRLSEHWVFAPFRLFLTVPQTDYLIVHWFVFAFDLTVAGWMMWGRTRHVAMLFCALFHLMNSRLFTIGMFPWVCLATMPLFYPFDWPKTVINFMKQYYLKINTAIGCIALINNTHTCHCHDDENGDDRVFFDDEVSSDINDDDENNAEKTKECYQQTDSVNGKCDNINFDEVDTSEPNKVSKEILNEVEMDSKKTEDVNFGEKMTIYLIFFYVFTQAFLPYSHFITKGYNNWTNGLYGYSWDMMVHSWDTHSVVIKVVDNQKQKEFFIDPYVYTPNDRWTKHGDMVHQYAHCLKKNLIKEARNNWNDQVSDNISIYIDVWCSMNGRFTQRMFDPKVDLLQVPWYPFKSVSFLMPLLNEALDWRNTLHEIREEIQKWSNYSDVIFIADFPGYDQEKYIPFELTNVTLTVLQGPVVLESEVTNLRNGQSHMLTTGNQIKIDSGMFHRVLNIGAQPAYYMYSFVNTTDMNLINEDISKTMRPKLPIFRELYFRFASMFKFFNLVIENVFKMCWMSRCQ